MITILYSSKISLLQRWSSFLEKNEFFVSSNQDELFAFLQKHDKPVIIIIENQIFEEQFKSFLATLATQYQHAKICVLSNTPNIKEGLAYLEIGIKGYGNSYMSLASFTSLLSAIKKDLWWFYPDFVKKFLFASKNNNIKTPKACINHLERLAIIRSEDEEKIAEVGDVIKEHEMLVLPYKDSKVTLNSNGNILEISGIITLLYEQSIFGRQEMEAISSLHIDLIKNIFDTSGKRSILPENLKQDNLETVLEHKKLYFSGIFNEYDILVSKKEDGYIIVNDKIENRDGGSLLCTKEQKVLVFKDKNHVI